MNGQKIVGEHPYNPAAGHPASLKARGASVPRRKVVPRLGSRVVPPSTTSARDQRAPVSHKRSKRRSRAEKIELSVV